MERLVELQNLAKTRPLTQPEAVELASLNAPKPDPTHLTSQTNYEAAKPVPAGEGTHDTSLTNYLNVDKTPVVEAPAVVAPAPAAAPAETAPVIAAPAEPEEEGFRDKLKRFASKAGVNIMDVIEGAAKGYTGSTSPTRLDKEYQVKLEEAERDFMRNIEAERRAAQEAADLRRMAAEQKFIAEQNALNRASAMTTAGRDAAASLIPE